MSQVLPIPFGSLNEGDDPKTLPPGTFTRLLNCRMDKGRRLAKRYGIAGLAKTLLAGGNISAGARLLTRGTDTGLTNGVTSYAYASSLEKWQPVDKPPHLRVTKTPLIESTRALAGADVAISGDMLITVYQAGVSGAASIFLQIESIATGEVLKPTVAVASGASFANPRVLVRGTTAYILYATTSKIRVAVWDLTTLTQSGSTHDLATDSASLTPYDACLGTATNGNSIYVIYLLASGTDRVQITNYLEATFAADVVATPIAGTGMNTACIAFGATHVHAAFSVSSGSGLTRIVTKDIDLGSTVGPTTVASFISNSVFIDEDDTTNVLVGWCRNDSSGTDAERFTTQLFSIGAHSATATSGRVTFGIYSTSKPWRVLSRWFTACVLLTHSYVADSTDKLPDASVVVVEIETADSLSSVYQGTHPQVATLENLTGWFTTAINSPMLKAAVAADGAIHIPAAYRTREVNNQAVTVPIAWNRHRLAPAEGDTFGRAILGGSALLVGGAPTWFDGASTMPYGFAIGPEIISVTAAAGGAVVAGTYSYVAVYEWRDANGLLHRSIPSQPKTGTTATTNLTLAVKVSTSSLSSKSRGLFGSTIANPVTIALYRTTIGGTGPHYRLALEPLYQLLVSNPQAGDVTLNDAKADANIASGAPAVTLASQAQLYTDVGELADVPPPAFVTCITHRGRLAGIASDLRTVWLSKDSTVDTTIAPGFNEALTLAFASDKTALASLDEKLVVFGASTIDVVNGDGPDDTGDQNTWSIQGVQTDVGCINPRSVVTSPMGIMFQSARGIELLDRGLSVSWVGDMIDDTLTVFPTITSAVLVAEQNEIRFTCTDGDTGVMLVWDYLYKTWFTRAYWDGADTDAADVAFVDAALINGVYTALTAGGQVYQETTSHRLDAGVWVGRDIILAPISPGGAVSWNRVKDLGINGTSVTPHDLAVSFARDYAASYETTRTFLAGSAVTAVGPLEKARVGVKNQKCQAIQIRIRDLTPTDPGTYPVGTGEGPIIEALALRVGVKSGLPLTSAGQEG